MTIHSDELIKQLRVQAAMAKEELSKVEQLFSNLKEGVIVTDVHGTIIRVNQATLDILGYKRKELIGQWFPRRVVAVRQDGTIINNVNRPIASVFITGKNINEEMFYKKKSGAIIPVSVQVSTIMSRNKPSGAIEIFRDITDDIRNEKIKTDFMSIASHQLRTPLSAINTYAHMLSEGYVGDLSAPQQSFIDVIISSTARMNELINTLLNLTRIETGNITIERRPTNLEAAIREVILEFRESTVKRHIRLRVDMKPTPIVKTDPLMIKEIVANLLSNAIKYTADSGMVKISLYPEGRDIIIRVHDNGYGIPAEAQSHIFTKFFRANNIIEKDVTGTGLGLYLIKVIAESLNGDVWFKSEEDKGTDFFFSIPQKGTLAKKGSFKLDS